MPRRTLLIAMGLLVTTGCKFSEVPPLAEDAATDAAPDAAADPDAPAIDAPAVQHLLTITIDAAGTGEGIVRVAPSGFTCTSGTCMRAFDAGTELTITVEGNGALDAVAELSGDCAVSPCSITVDGDRVVRARFQRLACVPTTESCAAGQYTQCSSAGSFVEHVIPNGGGEGVATTIVMNGYPCPMGCHPTQPRCADIDPGNAVTAALDAPQVSASGVDVVIPGPGAPAGTVHVQPTSFDQNSSMLLLTDTDGSTIGIPAQLVVQTAPAPPVLVLKTRTFTLRQGSTLQVNDPRALAIVAHFDIHIGGTIDASAVRPGQIFGVGPGSLTMSTTCVGGYTSPLSGGGGGYCAGGDASNGAMAGAAASIVAPTVVGGCAGGVSGGPLDFAGSGGGGLMLASRTRISLASSSVLDVSGGGGRADQNLARGGGSGGRVLLQAPVLSVSAGAVVAGRGGSGGAASATTFANGVEGPVAGTSGASSVTCSGCGSSGRGGVESQCFGGDGTGSASALAAGGGGVGVCLTYTRTGNPAVPGGTMRLFHHARTLAVRP